MSFIVDSTSSSSFDSAKISSRRASMSAAPTYTGKRGCDAMKASSSLTAISNRSTLCKNQHTNQLTA